MIGAVAVEELMKGVPPKKDTPDENTPTRNVKKEYKLCQNVTMFCPKYE